MQNNINQCGEKSPHTKNIYTMDKELICEVYSDDYGTRSFCYCKQSLYRTKSGEFFLEEEIETIDTINGKPCICIRNVMITEDEAIKFLEEYGTTEGYKKFFMSVEK